MDKPLEQLWWELLADDPDNDEFCLDMIEALYGDRLEDIIKDAKILEFMDLEQPDDFVVETLEKARVMINERKTKSK